MRRNGKTKAGLQRWRCQGCGASSVHRNDTSARDLASFVSWLLSKDSQRDMPGQGRAFRRRTAAFWSIWPMPEVADEVHRVVFVDGIWVARSVVALTACTERRVLSWHLPCAETSGPKPQAGIELYRPAKELLHIESLRQAEWWAGRFLQWSDFWSDFLEERSLVDGRLVCTHERLRKARRGIALPVGAGTLFTCFDPGLTAEAPLPATSNAIEGGVNAQLRSVLRNHRGLSTLKRVKAVFWWCYMHVERPKSMAQTLREMPTDSEIELLRSEYGMDVEDVGAPKKWGEGLVWEEFHCRTRYPYSTE